MTSNRYNLDNYLHEFTAFIGSAAGSARYAQHIRSDVGHFSGWVQIRKDQLLRNMVEIEHLARLYIAELVLSKSPKATVNRRLSSIRKFATFLSQSSDPIPLDVPRNLISSSREEDELTEAISILTKNDTALTKEVVEYLTKAPETIKHPFLVRNVLKDLTLLDDKYEKNLTDLIETPAWGHKSATPKKIFKEAGILLNRKDRTPGRGLPEVFQRYAVLIVIVLLLGLLGTSISSQFFKKNKLAQAFPTNLTRGTRALSFQGRLTDSLGNPITTATNVVFKLHTAASGGSQLYTSGTCSITPDQDGIFNSLIGEDCGSEITSAVFTENAEVWLSTTVGADAEMTPRQQIANVGYALNAETLQGFPPDTAVSSIPYINRDGNVLIGASTPGIRNTYASATFVMSSANAVTLQSAGSGDITLTATESGTIKFLTAGSQAGVITNGQLWGIGTTGPDAKVDSLYTGGEQLRLTYADGSAYTGFTTSSGGDLTIDPSGDDLTIGGDAILTDTFTLQVGGKSATAYNAFANSADGPEEAAIAADNDLYIGGDLEVDGSIYAGSLIASGVPWSGLTAPTADLTVAMDADNTTFTWDPTANSAESAFIMNFDGEDSAGDEDQVLLSLNQSSNGTDVTEAADALLTFTNSDANDPVENAIRFDAGAAGIDFTYGINFDSASIGTAELVLQNGETIANTVDGTIALTGDASVSGTTGLTFTSTGGIVLAGGTLSDGTDGVDIADNLEVTGDTTLTGDLAVNGDDITSDGTLTIDAATDIILDADGADVFLKDATVTFATLTNSSTDLTLDIAGGQLVLADGDVLNIGAVTGLAYNAISDSGTTSHSLASDDDLYVEGDLEVDGTLYVDGTLSAGSLSCTDCLDFTSFEDTLDLDATTDINLGASNLTIDLDSSGIFDIRDGTTTFVSFDDDSTIDITFPAAGTIGIDAAATDNTTTAGVLNLDIDTATDGNIGSSLDYQVIDAAGNVTAYGEKIDVTVDTDAAQSHTVNGSYIGLTANDASSTTYGLHVVAEDAGAQVATSGILIENLQATDIDLTTGLLIRATTDGSLPTALDVSDAEITTALAFGANDIDGTSFDVTGATGSITTSGDLAVNGDDITSDGTLTIDAVTDIILDADDADIFLKDSGTTFATFTNSSTDLLLDIAGGQLVLADADVFNIGAVTGLAYNAISDSGVTSHGLASDDDLYVEGDIEVDGTLWVDGTLSASGISCTDCLDFTSFEDTLDLDATTDINLGASNLTIDLDSSGIFDIRDGATTFVSFDDDSTIDITFPAAGTIGIDAAATDNTTTAGVLNLDIDTATSGNIGSSIDYQVVDAGGNVTAYGEKIDVTVDTDAGQSHTVAGSYIGLTANDASSTTYGLQIVGEDAGTQVATSGILIENLQATDIDLTTGLLIRATTDGSLPTAIDVSDAEITTALAFGANDIDGTSFDVTGSTGSITTAGDLALNGNDLTSTGDISIDVAGSDVFLVSGDNLNLTAAVDLIFGGTTSLGETTAANDSGAYLVGTFDEFDNSSSANVQDVLDDFDAAITTALAGGTVWTDSTTTAYLTTTTDEVVIGGTSPLSSSKLSIDGDADQIQLTIQGNATQTSSLAVFEDSAGTDLLTVSGTGVLSAPYLIDISNTAYGIDPAGTGNFGGYSLKVTGGALLGFDSGNVGVGPAAQTADELLHVGEATDGDTIALLLENSQAAGAASTNETTQLRFGFGGNNDTARIVAGKVNDYTSGANEDSFLSFYTDVNGTATEQLKIDELGLATFTGDIALNGDDLTSDSNLTISATGYVRIADSATPGSATGDDDLFVESDLEVNGIIYADGGVTATGTVSATDFSCTDCLDFAEFEDTLDLDAALIANQGTNTWTQNFTGTTTTGLTYNVDSLTSGVALALASTSTAITTNSNLLTLDWSPGSLTTAAIDLFEISTTTNGNVTGSYLNFLDNSASIFKVEQSGNVTTAGDLAVNGDDITADGVLTLNSASYVRVGDSGTPGTANGDDDLYVEGDLEVDANALFDGNITFGNSAADTVVSTSKDWTFSSDTTVVLSGGVDGINFDANTLSIDATNNRVGLGTAAPDAQLEVTGAQTGKALAILNETGDQNILVASSSGTSAFVITHNGDISKGESHGVNGLNDTGSLIPNSSLEVNSDATYAKLPDGWSHGVGTSSVTSSDSKHGDYALKITTYLDEARSTCFPMTGDGARTYTGSAWAKGSTTLTTYRVGFYTYASLANCKSHGSVVTTAAISNTNAGLTYAASGTNSIAVGATSKWGRAYILNLDTDGDDVTVDGILMTQTTTAAGLDLAETYPAATSHNIQVGEIVEFGVNDKQEGADVNNIERSSKPYSNLSFGVVATKPGIVLDDDKSYEKVQVALKGRVPVLVNGENGAIAIGDSITTSSTPGVGMKATQRGRVIGRAMTAYNPPTPDEIDQVTVFVETAIYDPEESDPEATDSANIERVQNLDPSIFSGILDEASSSAQLDSLFQSFNLKVGDQIIRTTRSFGQVVSASIKTGAIAAKDVIVQGTLAAGTVLTKSLEATAATITSITAQNIQTDMIRSASIESEEVKTDILVAETVTTATLSADTIASKTIIADTVDAKNIQALQDRLLSVAGQQLEQATDQQGIRTNIDDVTTNINQLQSELASLQTNPLPDPTYYQPASQFASVTISNDANIYNLYVSGTATFDDIHIDGSSIMAMTDTLHLTALQSIDLLDGAMVISRDGTITTNSELIAQGGIRTDSLKPIDDKGAINVHLQTNQNDPLLKPGSLSIQNELGNEVATIDANGQAQFQKLKLNTTTGVGPIIAAGQNQQDIGILAPGIETNASAAGGGILPANTTDVILFNTSLSDKSLVYLTPTSYTYNKSLFVASKNICAPGTDATCKEYVKISIDQPIPYDVSFNWWIIE